MSGDVRLKSSVGVIGAGIQGISVTLKPFLTRKRETQIPCMPAPMTPTEDFNRTSPLIVL
jgi:hypothetical protein